MNDDIVLDASALLALIQNEKGAEAVRPLLKKSVMSAINVAEVLIALQRAEIHPQEAATSISEIIPQIIPFDIEQAQTVAELHPHVQHKGLSLGDKACISLGKKLKLAIYTADRVWADLKIQGIKINLIR